MIHSSVDLPNDEDFICQLNDESSIPVSRPIIWEILLVSQYPYGLQEVAMPRVPTGLKVGAVFGMT